MPNFTNSVLRDARTALAFAAAVACLLVPARSARAQANLSTQGYGYPPGQLSSRAQGAGGALAEIDPLSPINPATIGSFGSRILYFQAEPEYRTVDANGTTEHTTVARYPVIFGAMPVGSRWVLSLGSSTLLDRTSSTTFTDVQRLSGGDSVSINTTYRVDGAMNDVRFAAAFTPKTWLRLGAGLHAIVGHNLVTLSESFPVDTPAFSPFTQQRVLSFSGGAASGGVELISKRWLAAFSARAGGTLHMSVEDTTITSANVPSRYGASLAYIGIANSAIAVRTSRENWSGLNGLGTAGLVGVDAWDTSVGADIAGPRFGSRILSLRAGFRDRTLPFQAAGKTVTEKSVTAGLGTTFANSHVLTDFAVIHASRSAALSASEKAWTFSVGISVRP